MHGVLEKSFEGEVVIPKEEETISDKKSKGKKQPKKLSESDQIRQKFRAYIKSCIPLKQKIEEQVIKIFGGDEKLLVRLEEEDFEKFPSIKEKIKTLKSESELKFANAKISKELLSYLIEICKERSDKSKLVLGFYKCEMPKNFLDERVPVCLEESETRKGSRSVF